MEDVIKRYNESKKEGTLDKEFPVILKVEPEKKENICEICNKKLYFGGAKGHALDCQNNPKNKK